MLFFSIYDELIEVIVETPFQNSRVRVTRCLWTYERLAVLNWRSSSIHPFIIITEMYWLKWLCHRKPLKRHCASVGHVLTEMYLKMACNLQGHFCNMLMGSLNTTRSHADCEKSGKTGQKIWFSNSNLLGGVWTFRVYGRVTSGGNCSMFSCTVTKASFA